MIKTFDFVFAAQRNSKLMQEIKNALLSQGDEVIFTDMQTHS